MVYLLPLLLLVIGALLGNFWFDSLGVDSLGVDRPVLDNSGLADTEQRDIYAAIGALLGLVLGFICAKWMSSRQAEKHFHPYIVRLWQ